MKNRILSVALVLLLAVFWLSCSDDDDDGSPTGPGNETVTMTIDSLGGTLGISSQISLTVMPDALDSTTEFSIVKNNSPSPIGGTMRFVSSVYTIEPTGTQFNVNSPLTIYYSEAALGGASEDSVVIYTNDGTGWQALPTAVTSAVNIAVASVNHLSDFAAAVDTGSGGGEMAEGVFVRLAVDRGIMTYPDEGKIIIYTDALTARFDSAVTPCVPVYPMEVDAVTCNEYPLSWDGEKQYMYMTIMTTFIEPGETYVFNVDGNAQVPDLVDSIDFPDDNTYITYPRTYGVVSLDSFTVTWNGGSGNGDIHLSLIDTAFADTTHGVFAVVPNTGSYTFTGAQLSELTAGNYGLVLNNYNLEYIDATGYDPNSFVVGKITSTVLIELE